jgi:flagellar M-ring protein FliF
VLNEPTGWLGMLQVTKDDIMRGIELTVMVLLGLIVLLFVVRPMVRRIVTPDEMKQLGVPAMASAVGEAGGGASMAAGEGSETKSVPQSQTAQMIDIAQVQGQVHAQSVHKVGELAQRNPQETVSIIRQWLHESAA